MDRTIGGSFNYVYNQNKSNNDLCYSALLSYFISDIFLKFLITDSDI